MFSCQRGKKVTSSLLIKETEWKASMVGSQSQSIPLLIYSRREIKQSVSGWNCDTLRGASKPVKL